MWDQILEAELNDLDALTRSAMLLINNTRLKTADIVEKICEKEDQATKYQVLRRVTRLICEQKTKIKEIL